MNWGAADRQNPDHDSLFVRFEQLDKLLTTAALATTNAARDIAVSSARDLVRLIRAQVLQ